MHPDHEGTPRFKNHLVVCTHLILPFHQQFVHGGGAFVLTFGCCCWVTVSLERATRETVDTDIVVKSHGDS